MSIEVNNETEYDVDLQDVSALADSVLKAMYLHPETEVSVVFIDEEAMSALHVEWMDLEICPTVAEAQAKAGGHSTHDEILLLTTHGLLHLMGFDHMEPDEKTEMFTLQRRLLEAYTGRPAPKETVE